MTTNRYSKRLVLVDQLINLGYDITTIKFGKRGKSYLIKTQKSIYNLNFKVDWLTITQDKDNLFCGINLSNGQKLAKSIDDDLTNLYNDVIKTLYRTTNIKIPKIIL